MKQDTIRLALKKDDSYCDEVIRFTTTGKLIINPFGTTIKLYYKANTEEINFFKALCTLGYCIKSMDDPEHLFFIFSPDVIIIME